jgi:probable HAF family extracellular repeat protein
MKRVLLGALVGVGSSLLSAMSLAQSPTFSVTTLGTLTGGTDSGVFGVNNVGDAVGSISGPSNCPGGCAVIWVSGTATVLGTGGTATSINNAGQVIGQTGQAVIWNNGTPTSLAAPSAEYTATFASYVNNSGQVAGSASGSAAPLVPIVWTGSTPTVLGIVSGYTTGSALGINNNGLVVGTICCSGSEPEAVVWHGTIPTLLQRLQPAQGAGGEALAVNNSGLVVGHASTTAQLQHAVSWFQGVLTDLGTLATGTRSSATAVNDRGIIVGESASSGTNVNHAVLWGRIGAAPQDLNALISSGAAAQVTLTAATGINDNCTIVANGVVKKTGATRAFLLTLTDSSSCVNGGL